MPRVGEIIAGKYRLEKVAGEGGMGVVYAAEHLVLCQRVAVKVLLPSAAISELVVERFALEAQAAARIQSEHVARVMDAGSTSTGAPFLVMEYLEGCDLAELLKVEGPLPLADVADYLLQALEALAHAHAVGLVHRDIKPANLFLACRPDGGNILKMLDFGISKAVRATPAQKALTGHAVLGSPAYMSPEQLRNAKDIDARADIWSIGVVAYELLTGKTPFDGDGVGEIFAAILERDPAPVHTISTHPPRPVRLPPEISTIVATCLKRKPEDRWPDAAALARALKPFGTGAFAPAVERSEQVLSRARMLTAPEIATGSHLLPAAFVAPSERGSRDAVKSKVRSIQGLTVTRWAAAAAAALAVVALVGSVAALRTKEFATSHERVNEPRIPPPPAPRVGLSEAANEISKGVTEDGDRRVSLANDEPDASAVSEPPRFRRNLKAGSPTRPKFLNSRE